MAKISYTENILKKEEIRIFGFRNRYVLVDPKDSVFMMFEKPETSSDSSLVLLQKDFKFPLTAYSFAKKIAFLNIPMKDFKFICNCYEEHIVMPRNSIPYDRKVEELAFTYKISLNLAKFFLLLPEYTNYDALYAEIQKAHTKLGSDAKLSYTLLHGSKSERIKMLKHLLPKKTCRILNVEIRGWKYVHALCQEIVKGKT